MISGYAICFGGPRSEVKVTGSQYKNVLCFLYTFLSMIVSRLLQEMHLTFGC